MTMETNIITKTCECGTKFETEELPRMKWAEPDSCPSCLEKSAREEAEQARQRQLEKLDEACAKFAAQIDGETPERLLATNQDDPRFNRELWAKVKDWWPSDETPWLGLVGEPGTCKSRIAFARLKELLIGEMRAGGVVQGQVTKPSFEVITGYDFKRTVMNQFSNETFTGTWGGTQHVSDEATSMLAKLKRVDLLLFDELGEKIKATPAVIEELFGLIDYRHSRNLVTLWTCNSMPEQFAAAWPTEFAGPIAGRIIESSHIITA